GGAGFGVRAWSGVPHFLCGENVRSRRRLQARSALLWQSEIAKSYGSVAADGMAANVRNRPAQAGLFYLARSRMLWHRTQAPRAGRFLDSLLASQLFFSGRFLHAPFSC